MPTATARPVLLALITCTLLAWPLACFDPPELDDALPPISDLGPVDTWAALDEAGPPAGGDGPPDDGPIADDGGESTGPDPALAQLRLTEALPDPPGKDGGADSPEFIEIINPGPLPVNLGGLRVTAASWPVLDATKLGLVGVELDVDGILVIRRWATDVDPTLATLDVLGSVVWAGFLHSGGLRNGDGTITLEAGASMIDQLVYGVDPKPSAGLSLCRLSLLSDTWGTCPPTPGTLGTTRGPDDMPRDAAPIPVGAVQIVEVLANPLGPASGEKSYEFVEILNTSENPVELSGCRIGDAPQSNATGVDPLLYGSGDGGCGSPTCLAPGARAIIVGKGYLGESGGVLVLTTDDSTIADGGLTNTEPVVLWSPRGEAISTYRIWRNPAGQPVPTDGISLHRIEPGAEDVAESWIPGEPTPGI